MDSSELNNIENTVDRNLGQVSGDSNPANAPEPFYSNPLSGEPNRLIANPEVAYDIAKVEATKGRDAAIGYEGLRRDAHENNLSEVEMQNLKVIEGMKKKYPYAVFEKFTSNGKPYLEMGNVLLDSYTHSDRHKEISNERSQIKDSLRELGDKLRSSISQKKNLNLPVKKLEYTLMNWCRPVPKQNEQYRSVFSVKGIFSAFVDIDNPLFGAEKVAPNWSDFSKEDVKKLSTILKLLNEHNRLLSEEHGGREITVDFWEKLEGEVSSPEDFVDLL